MHGYGGMHDGGKYVDNAGDYAEHDDDDGGLGGDCASGEWVQQIRR